MDHCAAAGGGRVSLGPGQYYSGTIVLKSGVELHLEAGAILTGSANPDDYLRREGAPGARLMGGEGMTALLFAEGAERVSITGEGTLDGHGRAFFAKKNKEDVPEWIHQRKALGTWVPGFEAALLMPRRPRALILLVSCREVRIELAHVHDSPSWTIHLLACDHAVIRSVELRGSLQGANTDGIDLDACRDVLVEDCDIFTGDDAIALKNTNLWGLRRDSRNITVRRCRLRSTTHGFTVGTETQRDFEDVILEDCRIERPGEFRCITGLGLSILDGGALRRVRVTNLTIDDAVAPIQIRLGHVGRGQDVPTPGLLEDILLENITVRGSQGVNLICGLPGHPIRQIRLRHLSFELTEPLDSEEIIWNVPELDTEFPPSEVWRFLPVSAFFFRDIEGLELTAFQTIVPASDPRPALTFRCVRDFTGNDITAQDALV